MLEERPPGRSVHHLLPKAGQDCHQWRGARYDGAEGLRHGGVLLQGDRWLDGVVRGTGGGQWVQAIPAQRVAHAGVHAEGTCHCLLQQPLLRGQHGPRLPSQEAEGRRQMGL